MEDLLFVEKLTIESLNGKDKNFIELMDDTGLRRQVLINVLEVLLYENIIDIKNKKYSLNLVTKSNWIKLLNKTEVIREEVKDILVAHINRYFDDSEKGYQEDSNEMVFKMKKLWFSAWEEKLLNVHIQTLLSFLKDIELRNRQHRNTIDKKLYQKRVIFLGHTKYDKILDEMLSAV